MKKVKLIALLFVSASCMVLTAQAKVEKILFDDFGINHVNIQPEFQKDDPKEIIVQD